MIDIPIGAEVEVFLVIPNHGAHPREELRIDNDNCINVRITSIETNIGAEEIKT